MSIREKLEQNSGVVTGVVVLLVVVAIGVIAYQMFGGRRGFSQADAAQHFFTVDDGQTWFAAPQTNVPPFDHQGQTAVRAHVFECDGEQFVGYVERFTPEARAVLTAFHEENRAPADGTAQRSGGMPANLGQIQAAQISGREVKKPGDGEWVSSRNPRAASEVSTVKCPDGSTANMVLAE